MSYQQEIKKRQNSVFRRLYFKRRSSSGTNGYEADWQLIGNDYVKRWGTVSQSIDDLRVSFFQTSGLSLELYNKDNHFNDATDPYSFFYSGSGRYGTLCKVEAGYVDSNTVEYPSATTMFFGILREDIEITKDNLARMTFKPASEVLQDFQADLLTLPGTMTAADVISAISTYTDGSGMDVFADIINNWYYNASMDTEYDITTATVSGKTFWDLLVDLAVAENSVVYVDRVGDFYFQSRDVTYYDTSPFIFAGINADYKTWGHNVKDVLSQKENVSNVWNYVKVQFDDADTTTSYYEMKETWQWGDSSSSFAYGVRKYDLLNTWIPNTATAANIADSIYYEHRTAKIELQIAAKFLPTVRLYDYVKLSYKSPKRNNYPPLWGTFLWSETSWHKTSPRQYDYSLSDFIVTNVSHNLDNFESRFKLREAAYQFSGYNSSYYNRDSYNE